MKKLIMFLLAFPCFFIEDSALFAEQPKTSTPEEEWLITDRDRGSREKPTLYYYNRQNVQYNRRYNPSESSYRNDRNYYNYDSSDLDTFNRSYYQDNTSPDLYLNQ